MRNSKNLLTLNVDSALALMQEIYNDVVEQRNTAALIMKKMLGFMKDAEDMSVIGPVIKEQQKIMNDCSEKKISLVKLQSALLKQSNITNSSNKNGFSKEPLSDDDKKLIEKLMESGVDLDDDDSTENYSM